MKNPKTIKHYIALNDERNKIDCYKHHCFFAFSKEQFYNGLKKIRLNDGEKVHHAGAGLYGTKEGIQAYFEELESFRKRMKAECDPQEVYIYEYNNHECFISTDGDDTAFRLLIYIFGKEITLQIHRFN